MWIKILTGVRQMFNKIWRNFQKEQYLNETLKEYEEKII